MVKEAINSCQEKGLLAEGKIPPIIFDVPKRKEHGDLATNIALTLASSQKMPAPEVARLILAHLPDAGGIIKRVEVAGPGFINFFLEEGYWFSLLDMLAGVEEGLPQLNIFHGQRVHIEYVSANPTGPLHVGHGRGGAVGDAIANILSTTGCQVHREYYVNDAGTQMETLGRSVALRCRELLGEGVEFPPECYQGDYIVKIADSLNQQERWSSPQEVEYEYYRSREFFEDFASDFILEWIKDDMDKFGVRFDQYFGEKKELIESGGIEHTLRELRDGGLIYDKDGASWFRSSAFGDEKDRVVKRASGPTTYFASDLAYIKNKFSRGFDRAIIVLGADHHGYVPRLRAATAALGRDKEDLDVILVQLVSLVRGGKPVAMSTRAGEFVTLREVVEEVGRDAARFFLLMRRSDSHLEFDLELARRQSEENPVYYVQYAHARIASILRHARERGLEPPTFTDIDFNQLRGSDDLDLIKAIGYFPDLLQGAALALEPHRIPFYLIDLSATFHRYYLKNRVVSDARDLSLARLFLVFVLKGVIKKGLDLIGVSAPERMG